MNLDWWTARPGIRNVHTLESLYFFWVGLAPLSAPGEGGVQLLINIIDTLQPSHMDLSDVLSRLGERLDTLCPRSSKRKIDAKYQQYSLSLVIIGRHCRNSVPPCSVLLSPTRPALLSLLEPRLHQSPPLIRRDKDCDWFTSWWSLCRVPENQGSIHVLFPFFTLDMEL